MKPHNFHAPGLPTTGHYSRVISRRPHIAQFTGKALTGCLCNKAMDGDDAYRAHLAAVNK